DDLKTAVTEACNNVVLHAYGDRVGKLNLRLNAADQWIEVVVSDQGEGLHGVTASDDHLHLGLPIISSLAERAEFLSPPRGGTEVRMSFRGSGEASRQSDRDEGEGRVGGGPGPDQGTVSQMLASSTGESLERLIGDDSLRRGQ